MHGQAAGDPGGVQPHSTVGNGCTEEPGRSSSVSAGRVAEYAYARGTTEGRADAVEEVGHADSTRSSGKPNTWGSGVQGEFLR